jgi:dethiobiotin synthetase
MAAVADRRPRGLFVTGTDTGVGKTLTAAALARFLAGRGVDVGVMKPVESGVPDPAELGEDGALLCWAAECEDPADLVSPYRLPEPLAPSLAAERAGVEIHLSRLVEAVRQLSSRHDFLIVEGVGGLLVPLGKNLLVADLARQLGFPLLIVCRAGLGTINHTLLTVEAARRRDLPLAGLIINDMPRHPGTAELHAPEMLAEWSDLPVWGVLPKVEGHNPREKVALLAERLSGFACCEQLARAKPHGKP